MIYEIDKEGFIIERYPSEFKDSEDFNKVDFCLTPLPQPLYFYKPRWSGTEWVECATQEEIDELTKVEPSPPSIEEQLAEKDAQILKLKEEQFKTQQMTKQNTESQQELIELLMMMGVI